MKSPKPLDRWTLSRLTGHPVSQLVAMASLCAVFLGVTMVLGWINLRRLDQIFQTTLFDRARGLTHSFGTAFRMNMEEIRRANESVFPGFPGGSGGSGRSLQELFLIEMTDLGRQLDDDQPLSRAGAGELELFRTRESLDFLGIVSREGNLLHAAGNAPEAWAEWASPVTGGREDIRIDLFSRLLRGEKQGYLAVGRHNGGATLLVLSRSGFHRRCVRFAAQRALKLLASESDLDYALASDREYGLQGSVRFAPALPQTAVPILPGLSPGLPSVREVVVPVQIAEAIAGEIRFGFRADTLDELLEKNRRGLILSALFMLTIGTLAIVFLHRNQQAYLRQLKEMERRVYQAERLSALGRLAGGMAHEIRNPLNAISMAAQRLQMEMPGKLSRTIQEEIRRLDRLLEDFLSLARNRLVFGNRDLVELLEQILDLVREEAEARGIPLRFSCSELSVPMQMDAYKMKQAILNLLKNALEAIPEQGSIELALRRTGKKQVEISLSDTGVGMREEEVRQIFDLDYTTKDKGVGLGLPIAREIVIGHGGEIQVQSVPGEGTTFRILLPLSPLDPARLDALAAEPSGSTSSSPVSPQI